MPIIGAIGNASEYAYRSNLISSPDPFDFTDLFNIEPGATYYSDYVKITGIKSRLRVSINPGTLYSIFAGVFDNQNVNSLAFDNQFATVANFSQDLDINLRYTSDPSFIKNNQSIRLSRVIAAPILDIASFDTSAITFDAYNPRLSQSFLPIPTVPAIYGQTLTSIVSIGASVQDWIIKVRDADVIPDLISFPDVVNIRAGIATTTASYVISGLEKNVIVPANITSSNGGIIVDNIKPSVLTTGVQNGTIINLDTISPTNYGETKTIDFAVGTATTTWKVTTEPLDLSATFTFYESASLRLSATSFRPIPSPAESGFPSIPLANLSTLYNTNVPSTTGYPPARFEIGGLNVGLGTPITFTNGAQYSITRAGTTLVKGFTDPDQPVINGDSIRVQLSSAATYSTTVTTTATVGTTSRQVWSITTIPDPTPPPPPPPPGPPPPPPPPPATNSVQRYWNNITTNHIYGLGDVISGSVQVDQASAASALSYNSNAPCFIGDENNGNDALVNTQSDAGGIYYFIRLVRAYNVNSTGLVQTISAGGGATVTDLGFQDIGPIQRPNGLFYNRYNQRFRNNNNGQPSLARSWRFNYNIIGAFEGGFKCYQSNPGGAQPLYVLYSHAAEDHLVSFSSSEGSPGYTLLQSLGWAYPGSIAQPAGTLPLYRLYIAPDNDHFYTTSDAERALTLARAGVADEGRMAWVPA